MSVPTGEDWAGREGRAAVGAGRLPPLVHSPQLASVVCLLPRPISGCPCEVHEQSWEGTGGAHCCRVFPRDTLDSHKPSPGHRGKYEGGSDPFLDFIAFNTVYRVASLYSLIFNNGCVPNQFENFLKMEPLGGLPPRGALTSWVPGGSRPSCLETPPLPPSGGVLVP